MIQTTTTDTQPMTLPEFIARAREAASCNFAGLESVSTSVRSGGTALASSYVCVACDTFQATYLGHLAPVEHSNGDRGKVPGYVVPLCPMCNRHDQEFVGGSRPAYAYDAPERAIEFLRLTSGEWAKARAEWEAKAASVKARHAEYVQQQEVLA